jgi:two-component system OmpR family response regulator
VDHSKDGGDGLHMALCEPYDAAIVDIMLPKLDRLGVIEELRNRKNKTPIGILASKRSVDDSGEGAPNRG